MLAPGLLARVARLLVVYVVCTAPAMAQSDVLMRGGYVANTAWHDEAFTAFEIGAGHTLALTADGRAIAWGLNTIRQCDVPAPPVGATYVAISAQGNTNALLTSTGDVQPWPCSSLGCYVPALPPGKTYTQVSCGALHIVALRSDGRLVAWGSNTKGQCNAPNPPVGKQYVRAFAGFNHSAGLLDDGSIVCFGFDNWGQSNSPKPPPGLTYVDVALGGLFTLALRSDGDIDCWGYNMDSVFEIPPLPPGVGYVRIDAGLRHALALRSDGVAIAWGNSWYGQTNLPPPPPGLHYTAISAGDWTSSAHLSDGSFVVRGVDAGFFENLPKPPSGAFVTKMFARAPERFAALFSDGSVQLWESQIQLMHAGGGPIVDVALGGKHTLFLDAAGNVTASGTDWYGETQVPVPPPGLRYTAIAAGSGISYAVRSDGQVVAWGDTSSGMCAVPPLPPGLTYVDVAAHARFAFALRSDGSLVNWGDQPPPLPPNPPAGLGWIEVNVGVDKVLARRSDGWTFGCQKQPPLGTHWVELKGTLFAGVARASDGSVLGWGTVAKPTKELFSSLPYGHPNQVACTDDTVAVVVERAACGTAVRACSPASPNSVSPDGAMLTVVGCPSTTENELRLDVEGLPPRALGFLVYGRKTEHLPFGAGWSCVGPGAVQISPVLVADASGVASFVVDLTQPPFSTGSGSSNPILAGDGQFFQMRYRDAGSTTARWNASDTQFIVFNE